MRVVSCRGGAVVIAAVGSRCVAFSGRTDERDRVRRAWAADSAGFRMILVSGASCGDWVVHCVVGPRSPRVS